MALTPTSLLANSPPRTQPKRLVHVLLKGGIDGLLTFDPKSKAAVESFVDVPYTTNEMGAAGDVPLGPLARPLWQLPLPIAMLHGVALMTGNHQTGYAQHLRLKTKVTDHMPGILDIIGMATLQQADAPPLPVMSVGFSEALYSPRWFGAEIFSRLDKRSKSELMLLAQAQRQQAQSLAGQTSAQAQVTAQNLNAAANLCERVAPLPRWQASDAWPKNSERFQRVLWALQHDLAATYYVSALGDFDTHSRNDERQARVCDSVLPGLAAFLQALNTTTGKNGLLKDNVIVVVSSEIGRMPRKNALDGKDHFPEAPFLLCGGPINTGTAGKVFGQTGKSLEALPLDVATGLPQRSGHSVVLDDIGATLLFAFSQAPRAHGYHGRVLPFMLA